MDFQTAAQGEVSFQGVTFSHADVNYWPSNADDWTVMGTYYSTTSPTGESTLHLEGSLTGPRAMDLE
jgi:hypothetical protein